MKKKPNKSQITNRCRIGEFASLEVFKIFSKGQISNKQINIKLN